MDPVVDQEAITVSDLQAVQGLFTQEKLKRTQSNQPQYSVSELSSVRLLAE